MVSLTTIDRATTEFNITDATELSLLGDWIQEASEAIEAYCNRKFTQAEVTEKYAGPGKHIMRLDRYPLVSISSIAYDGVTVLASEYEIHDAKAGLIFNKSGWKDTSAVYPYPSAPERTNSERKLYEIVYTGGYKLPGDVARDLPRPIERACLDLVRVIRNSPANPAVKKESVSGVYSVEYGDIMTGGAMPDSIAALLGPYRNVVV